jgi:hypothetical protein
MHAKIGNPCSCRLLPIIYTSVSSVLDRECFHRRIAISSSGELYMYTIYGDCLLDDVVAQQIFCPLYIMSKSFLILAFPFFILFCFLDPFSLIQVFFRLYGIKPDITSPQRLASYHLRVAVAGGIQSSCYYTISSRIAVIGLSSKHDQRVEFNNVTHRQWKISLVAKHT